MSGVKTYFRVFDSRFKKLNLFGFTYFKYIGIVLKKEFFWLTY